MEVSTRGRNAAGIGSREAEVAGGGRGIRVADHDADARGRGHCDSVASRGVDADNGARVGRLDGGVERVEDIANRIGLREIDLRDRAVDIDFNDARVYAATVGAAKFAQPSRGEHRGVEIALALNAARKRTKGLLGRDGDAHIRRQAEVAEHALAAADVANAVEHGGKRLGGVAVAPEEVDAAQVAVGDRQQRIQHRVDHGRLIATSCVIAADANLGQTNTAGLLQQIAHIAQRVVERVEGGVGLRKIANPLVAALDGVVEHADRRRTNGVLRRSGELLARRKANLQLKELTVGLLNAGKRNSRRQSVRYAREVGRYCAHRKVSTRSRQLPCRACAGQIGASCCDSPARWLRDGCEMERFSPSPCRRLAAAGTARTGLVLGTMSP